MAMINQLASHVGPAEERDPLYHTVDLDPAPCFSVAGLSSSRGFPKSPRNRSPSTRGRSAKLKQAEKERQDAIFLELDAKLDVVPERGQVRAEHLAALLGRDEHLGAAEQLKVAKYTKLADHMRGQMKRIPDGMSHPRFVPPNGRHGPSATSPTAAAARRQGVAFSSPTAGGARQQPARQQPALAARSLSLARSGTGTLGRSNTLSTYGAPRAKEASESARRRGDGRQRAGSAAFRSAGRKYRSFFDVRDGNAKQAPGQYSARYGLVQRREKAATLHLTLQTGGHALATTMGKATMGPRSPSPRRPGTAASAFPASERGTQPSTHGSSRVEEPGAGPASPSSPQRRPTTAQSKLERTKSKSGAVPRGSASFKTTGRGELFPTRAAGAHVGPYDAPVPTLHRTDKGAVKMDHQTTRAYAETQADPGERFRTPRPGSYFDSELWDYRGRDREGGHSPRAMHHQIRAPPTQPQEPSAPERPRTAGGLRDYIQTYRPTTVGGAGIAAGRPVSRGTLSKTVPFLSKTAPFMGSGGMRDPNDVVSKAREWGAERPWTTGGHGGACGRSGFTGPRRQTHLGVRGETRLLGVPEPAVLVVGRELETTVVLSERGVIAQPHVTGELSHHPSRNPLDVAPGHMHLRTAGDAQPWWGSADQPETVVGTPRRTPQGDYVTVWQAVDEDGTAWHDAPASQEPTWMADGAQITATVRMEDRERPTSALSGYNITSPLQNSRPTSPYAKRPQSSRPRGTARTPAMRMREMSVPEDGTTD